MIPKELKDAHNSWHSEAALNMEPIGKMASQEKFEKDVLWYAEKSYSNLGQATDGFIQGARWAREYTQAEMRDSSPVNPKGVGSPQEQLVIEAEAHKRMAGMFNDSQKKLAIAVEALEYLSSENRLGVKNVSSMISGYNVIEAAEEALAKIKGE